MKQSQGHQYPNLYYFRVCRRQQDGYLILLVKAIKEIAPYYQSVKGSKQSIA